MYGWRCPSTLSGWFGGLTINQGKVLAGGSLGFGDPVSGVLGQYKNGASNRQMVVNQGGKLEFTTGNIFGQSGTTQLFFTINGGGTLTSANISGGSNFFEQVLTLNGGTLITGNGTSGGQSYRLNNNVTVGGDTASSIIAGGSTYNGVLLRNSTTTFTVADATGNANADLIVSATLLRTTAL